MGQEYTAKAFKSGNSVALRLPKGLGVKPGEAAKIVQEDDANFAVTLTDRPKRKFNIDKVWGIGKHLDLKFIEPEDRVFEHRPLLWEDPEWLAAASNRKS